MLPFLIHLQFVTWRPQIDHLRVDALLFTAEQNSLLSCIGICPLSRSYEHRGMGPVQVFYMLGTKRRQAFRPPFSISIVNVMRVIMLTRPTPRSLTAR